ncbi:MAG: tetratricopeptide repeat protein [Tahibacter sp.]
MKCLFNSTISRFLLLPTLLVGCTTVGPRHAVVRNAPAQSIPVEQDLLAQMMGGEFALVRSDVPSAAQRYASAAALSQDAAIAEQATRLALAAHDYALARRGLQRWRALGGNDSGLLQVEASLALSDNNAASSMKALAALLQLPQSQGWRLLGQVLLSAQDKAAAGDLLQRLATPAALAGTPEEIWVAMSQLAYKLDHKAWAHTLADAALAKFSGSASFTWSAQLAVDDGDKAKARGLYADAIKRVPKDIRLRAGYALLLGEQGENLAAARVLAEGPQDDYSYAARAAYAARVKDKSLLQTLYKELKSQPEEDRIARAHLLGQVAELLEENDAALTWYQQAEVDSLHWFDAQMRIVVLLDGQAKHDQAQSLVHELQARSGDDPRQLVDVFLLEGELLLRNDRHDAAVEAYTRGLAALPDDIRLLYARALLAANIERSSEAERDLRRVLALKPGDFDAMNALGYTLADSNQKLDEALGLIEVALKNKPEEPAVIDSFGWVQFRLGHLDEAEQALRRAYAKQDDAEIAAHLGEVLWQRGNHDEARRIFEQARKKDAKNKSLLKTLQRLGV